MPGYTFEPAEVALQGSHDELVLNCAHRHTKATEITVKDAKCILARVPQPHTRARVGVGVPAGAEEKGG